MIYLIKMGTEYLWRPAATGTWRVGELSTLLPLMYTDDQLSQGLLKREREQERWAVKAQVVMAIRVVLDPEEYYCFRIPKNVVSNITEPAMFIAVRRSDVILADTN